MKRLLAVVGAFLMIFLAVAVRDRLDDEEDSGGARDRGRGVRDGEVTVVCARDLGDVCDALSAAGAEVRTEDAATTATALLDRDAKLADDVDGWIVPSPWIELVKAERDRLGFAAVLGPPGPVLARSPVVAVLQEERAAVLEQAACPDGFRWRCIGDLAGRPWTEAGGKPTWGAVRLGFPSPDEGGGLVVLGSLAAGFFGSTEFGSQDFVPEGFDVWLTPVSRDTEGGVADPVRVFLTVQGQFGVIGSLEAQALTAFGRSRVTVRYPEPVVTADVRLVPIAGSDLRDAGDVSDVVEDADLLDALAAGGWRVADRPLAAGLPDRELPTGDGLPAAGVLAAARSLWEEVAA